MVNVYFSEDWGLPPDLSSTIQAYLRYFVGLVPDQPNKASHIFCWWRVLAFILYKYTHVKCNKAMHNKTRYACIETLIPQLLEIL